MSASRWPPPDPIAAFQAWFAEAAASEPDVPDAMQVASVGPDGRPSLRTVLLKELGPDGAVFYTHLDSRKSQQLRASGWAAATLHWKSLARQVHLEGPVREVTSAEADAYFATRPRGSQLGAWASLQSEPLDARATLELRLAEVTDRFGDGPVPRPPRWGGWRIALHRLELWQGRPDRLHDRALYTPAGSGWSVSLLNP
jgi:pyridoxamine 5'-phosphate oxidase